LLILSCAPSCFLPFFLALPLRLFSFQLNFSNLFLASIRSPSRPHHPTITVTAIIVLNRLGGFFSDIRPLRSLQSRPPSFSSQPLCGVKLSGSGLSWAVSSYVSQASLRGVQSFTLPFCVFLVLYRELASLYLAHDK
jgi:hypothetical protein